MSVNAHRIFNGYSEHAFLNRIKLPENDRSLLREVRDEIRNTLKITLPEWASVIDRTKFLSEAANFEKFKIKTPKFRMQGSFSYSTVNDPAQIPPQEVDLDDGMFLPVSFLEDKGGRNPAIVSQAYFQVVEQILIPLCKQRGWELKEKASCVRVQVNNKAHVDIALYAIPDSDFETFIELNTNVQDAHSRKMLLESAEFTADFYRGLPADQIMLAHREHGWMASDPRKLEDWFIEAVRTHGEQVRYISRYLKAWRDQEWSAARLASIALMYASVSLYNDNNIDPKKFENRDDLALLAVAERLPNILQNKIPNPVVESARLDQGWTDNERLEFVEGAKRLVISLREAILHSSSSNNTINHLRDRFGQRISDNHDFVEIEKKSDVHSAVAMPAILPTGLFAPVAVDVEKEAVKLGGDERWA